MHTTRISLLLRVKDHADTAAWREFVDLYRPLIIRYARARGVPADDAEDLAQDCLAELARKLPEFEYDRRRGGFKRWLRVFVDFRARNHFRKRRDAIARTGDLRRPQSREDDPAEVWGRLWLQQHLRFCLERIRPDFEQQTYEAFERYVIDEWPVERVCKSLHMNANQVYIAKSRISGRLRTEMVELLGEVA